MTKRELIVISSGEPARQPFNEASCAAHKRWRAELINSEMQSQHEMRTASDEHTVTSVTRLVPRTPSLTAPTTELEKNFTSSNFDSRREGDADDTWLGKTQGSAGRVRPLDAQQAARTRRS